MALLVVDTQKLITNTNLYEFLIFESLSKSLINQAQSSGIEIIYVRHDNGAGSELTKGIDGFEIYDEFKPANGELIFDKNVNSAFKGTGLLEYLGNKEGDTIIIVGLQTEYCIDATIKCGFEHGFKMIVPANTNSTVNNDFMWNGRYAECIFFEKLVNCTSNYFEYYDLLICDLKIEDHISFFENKYER